jgi:hypothetical protein
VTEKKPLIQSGQDEIGPPCRIGVPRMTFIWERKASSTDFTPKEGVPSMAATLQAASTALTNLWNKISGRNGKKITPTDWQRAEMLWKINGVPKIMISFGARGGGAEFALWLRERLLEKKRLRGTEVYIDTIGMLLEGFGETNLVQRGTETAGIFAAYNDAWKGYYEYAMYQAQTTIFIVTQEWYASPNCREEHTWYVKLNDYVPNSMKGISLVMEDDALSSDTPDPVVALPRTLQMSAKRQWAVKDAMKRRQLTGNLKNVWTIDDEKLNQLFAMI